MKKNFLMLGLGLLVLTSCSESEVLDAVDDSKSSPIEFTPWVGKSTRANTGTPVTDNTVQVLKGTGDGVSGGFYVLGAYKKGETLTEIFNGSNTSHVTWTGSTEEGGNGSWGYAPMYFWEKGASYKFAAFAPALNNTKYDYEKNQLTITDFVADGKTDLIVAGAVANGEVISGDTQITSKQPVPLTFRHALSKVKFKFVNGWTNSTRMVISDIKLTNVKSKGTLITDTDLKTAKVKLKDWQGQATTTVETPEQPIGLVNSTYTDSGTGDYGLTVKDEYHVFENFLIPQNLTTTDNGTETNIELSFTVTVTYATSSTNEGPNIDGNGGHTKTLTAKIPVNEVKYWIPGNTYTYAINISGDTFGLNPIQFNVESVQGWDDTTPQTFPVKSTEE